MTKLMSLDKIVRMNAINEEENVYRRYELVISKGLFKTWIVHTAYGRINGSSQSKNYSFNDYESAARCAFAIIKKRLNSAKRIGINYKIA